MNSPTKSCSLQNDRADAFILKLRTNVRLVMKWMKRAATLGILAPAFWVAMVIAFMVAAIGHPNSANPLVNPFIIAAISIYTGWVAAALFLGGVCLHAVHAKRTQRRCPWAWWWILVVSASCCWIFRPVGTAVGVVLIVLLFRFRPFKIMKRGVEPAGAGDALQRA